MKKSFKWLLCVSLAATTFMAGCDVLGGGEEEHEHTYATTYSYDKNGHWIETICEDHEVEKLNLALHTGLEDGICDTCKYDEHQGAGHTYAEVLSKDETNHWYAPTCGHEVAGKEVAAHVDENNDKLCDTAGCGYDYNHTHTYATSWTTDANNHWHAATCECTIEGADKEAHVDEDKNGVCEVCEGATYESTHTHTYASGDDWSSDEDNHWYAATCAHTGLKSSVTAHNDADKDGDCDVCGWYDEDHTHTYATEWSKDEDNHWHAANCGHSGLTNDLAEHDIENGECTVCGYDGNHEHAYGDEWVADETNHWLAATCGCSLTVATTAHDGMEDGVCDTCGYEAECDHTPAEPWVKDETSHWFACPQHPAVTYDEGEHEGMEDGVCDVCEYADYEDGHVHTYDADGDWTSDYDNHWIASDCHSGVVKEGTVAEHTDEDEDGYCDTCSQELFENVIAIASSDQAANIVNKGMISVENYSSEEYYFEYGEGYFHALGLAADGYEYWYMAEGDGIFALQSTSYGLSVPYGATVANLNGYEISLSYDEVAYGASEAIAAFYQIAVNNGDVVKAYEDGVYSFSGFNANYQEFTVSFTIVEHTVYDEDWNATYVDYVNWFQLVIDDYYGTTYEITQSAGERTAQSPYRADEFIASEYDLKIVPFEYVDWSDVEGEAIEFTNTLTITKGNGVNLYLENVLPTTADLQFDSFSYTINGEEEGDLQVNGNLTDDEPHFQIRTTGSTPADTYTVVINTLKVSYTFTVTVTNPPVTEISAQVNDDGWNAMSEVSAYVGDTLQIRSQVNTNADASYTASITSANAADATLTMEVVPEQDMGWMVVAGYTRYDFTTTKAGTYEVTLVSAENSEITATLTITVSEPPKAEDVLNGSYSYSDYYGSGYTVYVTFTPAEEGGLSGTAAIALVDRNDAATVYNVNYSYDETNGLVFTNTDGSAFTDVTIIYEDYELTASWMYEGWWGPEPTEPGVLTVSDPYTPPTAEDMVAGQYRLEVIGENGWSLESATDIVLNADGTGTYTRWHFDDSYNQVNDATATFKWTVVANEDGTYTVTVTDVTGATELTAGAWTVGTVTGTDNWGYPTTYTAITGVMVNNVATEFPIYE